MYKYLEHGADVGIWASGHTLEEAFVEGAIATFGVMTDIAGVEPTKKVEISCSSTSIPSLFVEWLNELISMADMETMFFSRFKINKLSLVHGLYRLEAEAFGERIDQEKHTIKTEVKAATYYGLKYETKGNEHILQCVVDV